ncbi:hypothetical protein Tco_0678693 [Tanacetum coccineum]|uniref:Uncharacterized protein n=1 Tax=Tanacetum coccineum TaxID=301880 RepID=A0ABQ4XFS8_9ASTR
MDNIIQPLVPKTLHTTPPDENYVAPATKSILDDLLEEFRDEILNVAMVDEGAECSPTKDLEELERLFAKDPQCKEAFQTRLVGCYFCDDNELLERLDVARGRVGCWETRECRHA